MNKIYVWCSRCSGNCHYMIASDKSGKVLADHISSDHEFGINDIEKNKDIYEKEYPDGYELVWVERVDT